MALAPLPPSNTKRYFVGIQDPNAQHHMQIRVAPSYSDASALSDFTALFTAMADVLFDDYVFNELLVAEKGSDIRNPVSGWIPIVGAATFSQADHDYPLGITARGRSATGRKARFTLWGQFFTVPTNWLYVPVGAGRHDALISTANTSATTFLAIDESKPVWSRDYTVDYNDHWVAAARP